MLLRPNNGWLIMPNDKDLMAYDFENDCWKLYSQAELLADNNIEPGAQVNAWITSPSKFHVNKNAVNQTITRLSWTKLTWAAEEFDIGSDFDLANNKYVAPSDGYYHFMCAVYSTDSNNSPTTVFYKNGAACKYAGYHSLPADNVGCEIGSIMIKLSENDEIEVYFWHNNGDDAVVYGNITQSFLAGYRV